MSRGTVCSPVAKKGKARDRLNSMANWHAGLPPWFRLLILAFSTVHTCAKFRVSKVRLVPGVMRAAAKSGAAIQRNQPDVCLPALVPTCTGHVY